MEKISQLNNHEMGQLKEILQALSGDTGAVFFPNDIAFSFVPLDLLLSPDGVDLPPHYENPSDIAAEIDWIMSSTGMSREEIWRPKPIRQFRITHFQKGPARIQSISRDTDYRDISAGEIALGYKHTWLNSLGKSGGGHVLRCYMTLGDKIGYKREIDRVNFN